MTQVADILLSQSPLFTDIPGVTRISDTGFAMQLDGMTFISIVRPDGSVMETFGRDDEDAKVVMHESIWAWFTYADAINQALPDTRDYQTLKTMARVMVDMYDALERIYEPT